MQTFNLWDEKNDIVKRAYREDNYLIWDRPNEENKCLILFSGNGIFFPNTEEVFREIILEKNRYEYQNLAKSDSLSIFSRIIFIRDIYKQWYISGINERYSDVNATVSLLKEKTAGYRVTTAGNSAGGYAAVLFGILLGAESVFSFSGQYSIVNRKDPLVEKYREDLSKSQYYDLRQWIKKCKDQPKIYYFWPDKNEQDQAQYKFVQDLDCVRKLEFISKKHERTVLPFQIPFLLSRNVEQMEQICRRYERKKINSWFFLVQTMGIYSAIKEVVHYLFVKIKSR